MLICGWAGSSKPPWTSRGKSSFFFPPVQLHLALSDLLIPLGLLRFLVAFPLISACRENVRHFLLETMVPVGTLRWMYSVCTRELVHGFEPLEGFQCHPRFELCAILFPLCRPLCAPLSPHIDTAFYLNHLSSFRGTL